MSAPAPSYSIPWHCPDCGVEWSADRLRPVPCWLCGGQPAERNDTSTPWTASGTYKASLAEKELA